jgi:phytoene dehydrogenase-like protein
MHTGTGGLATSWHRNGYTFETCLHWLLGAIPQSAMYQRWREVFDIEKLTFINPQQYGCIEDEHGDQLIIYTDPDRMEAELLHSAPQDAHEIHRLASAVRRMSRFDIAEPDKGWLNNWSTSLAMSPALPVLRWWSSRSLAEYGDRFTHSLLRGFFGGGESRELSAIALAFRLPG